MTKGALLAATMAKGPRRHHQLPIQIWQPCYSQLGWHFSRPPGYTNQLRQLVLSPTVYVTKDSRYLHTEGAAGNDIAGIPSLY
eukprot:jgi/Psemu1/18756/gm1.18756_g